MTCSRIFATMTAILLTCTCIQSTNAQITNWISSGGGVFHKSFNWSAGVPTATDSAEFSLPDTYSVLLNANADLASINVHNGDVEFQGGNTISVTDQSNVRGTASFTGTGTKFVSSDLLRILGSGGTLHVLDGATVNNTSGIMGWGTSSTTIAEVSGSGSQWNNSSTLHVGFTDNSSATLDIRNDGVVTSANSRVGDARAASGRVNVLGAGSQFVATSFLNVGDSGTGELNVESGGTVTSGYFRVGADATGTGVVTVKHEGSTLSSGNSLAEIGRSGNGTLNIESGGVVNNGNAFVGRNAGSAGVVNVSGKGSSGTNSQWNISRLFMGTSDGNSNGGLGTLNIGNFGIVNVGNDATATTSAAGEFVVGADTFGGATVDVFNGSQIDNSLYNMTIGKSAGFTGEVNVNGAGSTIDNGTNIVYVGKDGTGSLNILNGGQVNTGFGWLAIDAGSTGTALVSGTGSTWNNTALLFVGVSGSGVLTVEDGGTVNCFDGSIGTFSGVCSASVTGPGSSWNVGRQLKIRNSTLTIEDGGTVNVLDDTVVQSTASVDVYEGGIFKFGSMTADSYSRVNGSNGILEGGVEFTGYHDINSLDNTLAKPNLDTTGVRAGNSGVIHGSGFSNHGFLNTSDAEVRTLSGQWMRFGGTSSINAGQINIFGGTLELEKKFSNQIQGEVNLFDGTLIAHGSFTNNSGGFIAGRGQLLANGGLFNEGVIVATSGNLDVLGDVENRGSGQIVTSGFASTTFFDDVIHNGVEIRTAAGSSTIFLGEVSGAGAFTGTGDVFFEGDLRPGNSPDIVTFDGSVFLGSGSETLIELGGIAAGNFDSLLIAGNLDIAGGLSVSLIDGFELGANQQFSIADVGGTLSGEFSGLGEGALVGSFGGRDLFISYNSGNGNDVSLFTSVPEPASAALLTLAGCVCLVRRRRQRTQS